MLVGPRRSLASINAAGGRARLDQRGRAEAGMREKSEAFKKAGEIYVKR